MVVPTRLAVRIGGARQLPYQHLISYFLELLQKRPQPGHIVAGSRGAWGEALALRVLHGDLDGPLATTRAQGPV